MCVWHLCVDESPGSKAVWKAVQNCSRAVVLAVGCYHGMSDGADPVAPAVCRYAAGCLNAILLYQSISTARARRNAGAGAAAGSSGSSATQQQQQSSKQQRPQTEAGSSGPEGPAGGFPALQPAT